MRRRRFLGALGAAGAAGLTGCTSSGSGPSADAADDDEPWTVPDHPALAELGTQPVIGPEPGQAPGLIVGFEDPACVTCKRFEERTLPRLQSELIASGRLSFVYRVFPITLAWGRPASQALESTYDAARAAGAGRDAAAFWGLKDHYYAEHDAFTIHNVYERTETYLANETDLDAAAIVEAAREKRHDERVEADMDAGEAAEVLATPTFFLFREGELRTTVLGAQSYDVFAAALGF